MSERITNSDGTEKDKGIIRVATMDNVSVVDLDKRNDKVEVDEQFKPLPNQDRGGYIPPKGVSVEEATQPKMDERVVTVKSLREFLHGFEEEVSDIVVGSEREQVRYKALAITNIELARMWMGRLLAKLNVPYPYPNSVDPNNDVVDPATDVPMEKVVDSLSSDSLTACKQSRVAIDNVLKPIWDIRKDFSNGGHGKVIVENIYTYLSNAKMYLGWMMVKIKEAKKSDAQVKEVKSQPSIDDLLNN